MGWLTIPVGAVIRAVVCLTLAIAVAVVIAIAVL